MKPTGRSPRRPGPKLVSQARGKAVSHTNLLIHLNRVLKKYEDEKKVMNEDEESTALQADDLQEKIYRLDRADRDTEVQEACQVLDLDSKEEFFRRCENLGIPPFAMTYFLDNMARYVTELVMRNLGIAPEGAAAVAEILAGNSSVRVLDLSVNGIQNKGAFAVAQLLEHNQWITDLNISENNLSKSGLDSIGNMLILNNTLTCLDVSRNSFTCDDIHFLTNVLQTADALLFLDLRHNAFKEKAGLYLGEMVKKNTSLRELYIGWNHFGDEGAKHLCAGLQENRSLEILDICWNEIGRDGAGYIAEFIENNGRLVELNLDNNHITDHGLRSIARGLEVNETLRLLKVGFNLITSSGACKILECLCLNPHSALETLHLAEVEVTSAFEDLFWRVKVKKPLFRVLEMSSPGGDHYHFQKPPSALAMLDDYLQRNGFSNETDEQTS
ncbi:leucine-rich repeat-containing protein 74B isoform X2 [Nematostella vectensis]|uniref:leucine-rich repeat-containing protein 74B isoform X2 n=1 Tax=Nematostella vectensis TaxID=45351 RepID=UPI002076E405|nr:leucine-rich repeat-containing protein 74B isoform X2 [Nematostella vectensis]